MPDGLLEPSNDSCGQNTGRREPKRTIRWLVELTSSTSSVTARSRETSRWPPTRPTKWPSSFSFPPDQNIVLHLSYFLPSRAGDTHLCNHPRETPNGAATSVMVSPEPFLAPCNGVTNRLKVDDLASGSSNRRQG